MDKLLRDRIEESKKIQEILKEKGYICPIGWEDIERAMIYNYNEQKKYSQQEKED